ncbi:metallophosphoesterase [Deinococcus maricopensis]|uniref:Metallophosphoesterase n=1 Tax=Deinococcus maricopensis (strain DSM 21211 / LMG 22137 / NRRL B-23946 / LB-34) TaxID=709986 RepID=E8U9N8_DEIML|nr:metallophosphoesterase [Deinococcus maricopensis]ADV67777.1 metallophosphoesterase [Deinococcus maricopensis DSM 21211]
MSLRGRRRDVWVVGDVHGALRKLISMLHAARLTDARGRWTGGSARVVFLGDYLDRGPDGLGVVRLVRALERDAAKRGGNVTALLGNHEVMFLAALQYPKLIRHSPTFGQITYREYWRANGGQDPDLTGVSFDDLTWLRERPAAHRDGNWLMMHADSTMYLQYGQSLRELNQNVLTVMTTVNAPDWEIFMADFAERLAFRGARGADRAQRMLRAYGGDRIVHGHTPVQYITQDDPDHDERGTPLWSGGGLALNVDGGMAYVPNGGFIVRLTDTDVGTVIRPPDRNFWFRADDE